MIGALRRRAGSALFRAAPLFPPGAALTVEYFGAAIAGMVERDMRQIAALPVEHTRLAIDVGANRGWFTWALLCRFDRVIAIEPNPELASRLAALAPDSVRVEPVALSDREGTGVLKIPVRNGQTLAGWAGFDPDPALAAEAMIERTVEVQRLDCLVDEPVALIKIDVEGHEAQVIAGADRLLTAYRPTLLVEIRPDAEADVSRLLRGRDYLELPWGCPAKPCHNRLFVPAERAGKRFG